MEHQPVQFNWAKNNKITEAIRSKGNDFQMTAKTLSQNVSSRLFNHVSIIQLARKMCTNYPEIQQVWAVWRWREKKFENVLSRADFVHTAAIHVTQWNNFLINKRGNLQPLEMIKLDIALGTCEPSNLDIFWQTLSAPLKLNNNNDYFTIIHTTSLMVILEHAKPKAMTNKQVCFWNILVDEVLAVRYAK